MRNILLEKSYTQFAGKTSPRPFFKKIKIKDICMNCLNFYAACFLLYAKLRAIKIYWN